MWVADRMLILERRGREAVAAGEQALRSSRGHLIHQGCPSPAVLSQGVHGGRWSPFPYYLVVITECRKRT